MLDLHEGDSLGFPCWYIIPMKMCEIGIGCWCIPIVVYLGGLCRDRNETTYLGPHSSYDSLNPKSFHFCGISPNMLKSAFCLATSEEQGRGSWCKGSDEKDTTPSSNFHNHHS